MTTEAPPAGARRTALEREKRRIIEEDGPWRAHNIRLAPGLTTMDHGGDYARWKWERCLRSLRDTVERPLPELRILDLACMEGLYSIELARRGAQTVGVEIRDKSLRKAEFARSALGLSNAEFRKDDVRRVTRETYGMFDVVLMNGILFHLDAPDLLKFLENISDLCTHTLYIDTQIALKPMQSFQMKDMTLEGAVLQEFSADISTQAREDLVLSAYDNPNSFLLTLPSLLTALETVGFTSVYRCDLPRLPTQEEDEVVLVARKG